MNECGYHYVIAHLRIYLLLTAKHILEIKWRRLTCQVGAFVGGSLADRGTTVPCFARSVIRIPVLHGKIYEPDTLFCGLLHDLVN